jgi:hypothetical protein
MKEKNKGLAPSYLEAVRFHLATILRSLVKLLPQNKEQQRYLKDEAWLAVKEIKVALPIIFQRLKEGETYSLKHDSYHFMSVTNDGKTNDYQTAESPAMGLTLRVKEIDYDSPLQDSEYLGVIYEEDAVKLVLHVPVADQEDLVRKEVMLTGLWHDGSSFGSNPDQATTIIAVGNFLTQVAKELGGPKGVKQYIYRSWGIEEV